MLDDKRVVDGRLDTAEQDVEGRDVDPDTVDAVDRAFDERRSAAGERVDDPLPTAEGAAQEDLDELWHELAEIRMQSVHVLCPLPLGKFDLAPGKLGVKPRFALVGAERTTLTGLGAHCRMLTARETMRPIVTSETSDWMPISPLARRLSGIVSVGLNAVAFVSET